MLELTRRRTCIETNQLTQSKSRPISQKRLDCTHQPLNVSFLRGGWTVHRRQWGICFRWGKLRRSRLASFVPRQSGSKWRTTKSLCRRNEIRSCPTAQIWFLGSRRLIATSSRNNPWNQSHRWFWMCKAARQKKMCRHVPPCAPSKFSYSGKCLICPAKLTKGITTTFLRDYIPVTAFELLVQKSYLFLWIF